MLKNLLKGVKVPQNSDLNTIQSGWFYQTQSRNLLSKWMSAPDIISKPSTPFFSLNRPKKSSYLVRLKKKRKQI